MKRTNSISKKILKAIGVLAIVIACFGTYTIQAQSSDEDTIDLALAFVDNKSCYTLVVHDCGLQIGEAVFCSFNAYYGKPYSCTEMSCYGTRHTRTCHRVYY